MSLPTFPELMASLQLSSRGEPEPGATEDQPDAVECSSAPPSPPSSSSSSSSSTAARQYPPSSTDSPSIIVSQFDSTRQTRSGESRCPRSLGRSNRFAPYLGATPNTQLRRSSVDVVFADVQECDVPERSSSASPILRPTIVQDVKVKARPPRLHKVGEIGAQPDVPISSFARRRTPQSSPTASTFPHRRRSSSQTSFSPVMLPSLIPGLTSPSPPHTANDMDVSEMEDHVPSQPQDLPKPRNRHQGLRLSSYRDHPQGHGEPKIPSVQSAA